MQVINDAGDVVYEWLEPVTSNIGIGITTRNRPEVLEHTINEIRRLSPAGSHIVIVDDASDTPVYSAIRFDENVGIARAKNACLEALMADPNIQHIFLFDDDAYPLVENWWEPYVNSPEPHLMRIFPDLVNEKVKLNDIKVIYEGDGHIAYTGPRGIMLYVERRVVDAVGGMDVAYGKWGYEHGDWSNRIHNAGFSTWRFADVIGGEKLIYSLDEHSEVNRNVPHHDRQAAMRTNMRRYYDNWNSSEYKEFRAMHNVVLTCLFTGKDPQRPHMRMSLPQLDPLLDTLKGHEVIVFTNEPNVFLYEGKYAQHCDLGAENVYFQRWITYWRWLRDHPEIEYVWCVDGTDVKLLRDPWKLEPGTLYLGSEQHTVSTPWLRENHPLAEVGITVDLHPDAILLNAGLVGGERAIVMEFIFDIIRQWQTAEINVFHKKGESPGIGDMGVLNVVGHSPKWQGRIHTGPDVNTIFKQNQTAAQAPEARWSHK